MEQAQLDTITGWFAGRLPDGWFTGAPAVTADEQQLKVVGTLAPIAGAEGLSAEARGGAEAGRIARFREETRGYRMAIAREAERRFNLPIQWGATCGSTTLDFTPGAQGRRGEQGEEARKVMIAARREAIRAWRRHFFGRGYGPGPRFGRGAGGRGWQGPPVRPTDFQGF